MPSQDVKNNANRDLEVQSFTTHPGPSQSERKFKIAAKAAMEWGAPWYKSAFGKSCMLPCSGGNYTSN